MELQSYNNQYLLVETDDFKDFRERHLYIEDLQSPVSNLVDRKYYHILLKGIKSYLLPQAKKYTVNRNIIYCVRNSSSPNETNDSKISLKGLCFSDKYQRVKGTFVKEIDRMITCNLSMEGFKQGQPLSFIWTTVNRAIIYTSHYLFTRNSTRAEITNKIYLYENFLLPENKLRMEVHYRGRQIAEKEIRLVEQGIYGKDGSFQ